jgi:DNA-binding transcriptional LysR family regulator
MPRPDLNQLVTLDVLLAEGSVARAARRLRLSPSAMSRALARLRETTGDPLLVRAGRSLVPTPRALDLRDTVGRLVEEAEAVLRPAAGLDLAGLRRRFTLRTSDGFVENFGPDLLERVAREAPGVRLRFLPKTDRDSAPLRDGSVDLETGVVGRSQGPEVRAQALFEDRILGVVRPGHPLATGPVTLERYLAGRHILVSRRGADGDAVDEALASRGLARDIATEVGGFAAALALARATDLVAAVPERHTTRLRAGLVGFPLPVPVRAITIAMLWHPRMEADPAHRWLRGCVREVCRRIPGPGDGAAPDGPALPTAPGPGQDQNVMRTSAP